MDRINRLRVFRLIVALMIVPNLVMAVIDIAGGHGYWIISAFAILFIAGALCFQTATIRRLERDEGSRGSLPVALLRVITGRKRADYARIRELEIECGLIDQVAEANAEWRALGSPDARIPGMTPIRLIRVEPKSTGRRPKRFDISEDRAAMRALARTYLRECDSCRVLVNRQQRLCVPCEAKALNPPYRPENHPWTGRDD